jgi:hypothetical protein
MQECQDSYSARRAYEIYQEADFAFYEIKKVSSCLDLCFLKRFVTDVKHYHKTSWINLYETFSGVDEFYISMVYSSLDVESRYETLVYDFRTMLAATGGNLGLMLGFSCLTCIEGIIDFLEIVFNKIFKT